MNPRLLASIALAATLAACDPNVAPSEPPLRPLLFTESAPIDEFNADGWELWTTPGLDPHAYPGVAATQRQAALDGDAFDLRSPEGTIRTAFAAATRGDTAQLHRLALDAEGLVAIARVPPSSAVERAENLQRALDDFTRLFRPDSATDARPDGLSGLIQPTNIQIGAPRTVDGALVRDADDAEMHSANLMRVHILSSTIDFDVRFPRLLKDANGEWKLSDAPSVSDTWLDFRRPGLDLKPELMAGEHAPLPFDVGNFWHYELRLLPLNATEEADIAPTRALAYRDTVSEIFQGQGGILQVVTLRRTFADPARNAETRNLLVTARHIYPCTNECYRRRENLSFLLGYMGRTTPLFVFPANRDQSWREGGRARGRALRVAELMPEVVTVPAGSFRDTVHIRHADGGTGASIYFAEGVGILREETRQGGHVHQANLIQYRILR